MEDAHLSYEATNGDSEMRSLLSTRTQNRASEFARVRANGCEESALRLHASGDCGREVGLRKAACSCSAKEERELEHLNSTALKLLYHRKTTSISRQKYQADWRRLHMRNDVALEMSFRRVGVERPGCLVAGLYEAWLLDSRTVILYWTTPDTRSHHRGARVSLTSSQVECG